MRVSSKRDILRLQNQVRKEIGQRFQLRIAVHPPNQDRAAAPFATHAEKVDPSTDKLVVGVGVFMEQRNTQDKRGTGAVNLRKAWIDVHPTYEEFFRRSYAVKVFGSSGLWEVTGVTDSAGQLSVRVWLQGRQ